MKTKKIDISIKNVLKVWQSEDGYYCLYKSRNNSIIEAKISKETYNDLIKFSTFIPGGIR